MKKVLSKIVTGTALALSLSSSVGMVALSSPITAYASNLNYHTNYDQLRVQSVYSEGNNVIVLVNVGKSLFEVGGVNIECRPSNGNWFEYWSSKSNPTKTFSDGTISSYSFNNDTQKYEVRFVIKKSVLGNNTRGYIYNYVGDGTGVVEDTNGGYGYQLW